MSKCKPETKIFHVLDVLTIVTGRLVATNRMTAVYEILDWITNSNLQTIELPQVGRKCTPWLLQLFPELKPSLGSTKSLDEWLKKSPTCPDEGIKMWLTELKMMFPDIQDTYDVPRIS